MAPSIPIITEAELRAAMTPARAVEVMREAFRADGLGHTRVPPVINLDIPGARGEFHVKTAHIAGVPHIAVKVASGFYDNPSRGLPTGSGLFALFDASTGLPAALLLDNGFLTDIRTGAAGAIAAEVLARDGPLTLGVIGAGVQARVQAQCLAIVRSIERIVVWSLTPEHGAACCVDLGALGFDASVAASAEDACRVADVLVTATPSRRAIVQGAWLRPGMHVTAVGADAPGKQELDPSCLDRADLIVVDRYAQCAAFGELKHAIDLALVTRHDVHAELGAIVAGHKPGRTKADQITIADLTGVGFQDTAIGSAAAIACASGL